jgi:hypothetical protein
VQIRWLMLAGGGVVVLLIGGWVGQALGLSVDLAFAPFLLAIVVLVPLEPWSSTSCRHWTTPAR